jgi:hypothetical protein
MKTATKTYGTWLQCWPGGESFEYRGEAEGMRVRQKTPDGGYTDWRKPSADVRRKIEIQRLALIYQDREILACDSALVDDCLKLAGEHSAEFFREWEYENIQNLQTNPDDWDAAECRSWMDERGIEDDDEPTEEDRDDDEEADRLREIVRDNSETAEIFEWWRVNGWFAKELAAVGECVLSNNYGDWWGRCTTGQQYIMDGVLQKVAARHV